MPMTKILREYDRPIINVEHTEYGLRLIALREIDEERTPCSRHQSAVPARFRHPDEHRDDDHAVARAGR